MMAMQPGGFREKKNPAVRPGAAEAVSRVRIRLARGGQAARVSPREQLQLFREMVSVSGLDYAVKSGNVKMSFGPAIVEGYESRSEYADLFLKGFVDSAGAAASLCAVCPAGYEVLGVRRVPVQFPSVEEMLAAVSYTVRGGFDGTLDEFDGFVGGCGPILREKSDGRVLALNPAELVLKTSMPEPGVLGLLMAVGAGRNLRPELLLGRHSGRELAPGRDIKVIREEFFWKSSDGSLIPVWD
ncbi:MAG: DUF2344 domain-containing protein [Elusimicrobiaceae bacterium]|nr:DUF2344 domain-containing protein [Elusimicrobiaceae bacterium]